MAKASKQASAKKASAKKAAPIKAAPASKAGYKAHRFGSRKGKVHEAFDKKGFEAASDLAAKLKLGERTIYSWAASWGGVAKAGKAARA